MHMHIHKYTYTSIYNVHLYICTQQIPVYQFYCFPSISDYLPHPLSGNMDDLHFLDPLSEVKEIVLAKSCMQR